MENVSENKLNDEDRESEQKMAPALTFSSAEILSPKEPTREKAESKPLLLLEGPS